MTIQEQPRVSVVVIFLDAERFLDEAIRSVAAQTYPHWELILVDDGSSDRSTAIAREWAGRDPGRIRYLEHPGHANRGMSASRNLGIRDARGPLIALLDADDVWLPEKLERQVALLAAHPEAGMVYGRSEYWSSWDPAQSGLADRVQEHHVEADRLYDPPELLALHLRGAAALPCPASVLARAGVVREAGGFEESFRTLYEDQAFFAKVCLAAPVFVSNDCLDRYRQHAAQSCAVAADDARGVDVNRERYLTWLRDYLGAKQVEDPRVWEALGIAFWLLRAGSTGGSLADATNWRRVLRKWVVRLSFATVPPRLRRRLWRRQGLAGTP